jgi:putative ABC transport system permease protein
MLADLRFAARMLRKNPGFTLPAIAALALGIGANCAIFSVVNAVLLAPLPYADPRHLYEIGSMDQKGQTTGASIADFVGLRERSTSFVKLSVDRFWSFTLTDRGHDAERVYGRGISTDTLALLGVPAHAGRIFLDEDFRHGAPRVAVLSYRLWKRRYSQDPHVIGTQMQLDGDSFTIVGVMPPQFPFPFNAYEIYVPWIFSGAELGNRKDHGSIIYARVRPGKSLAQAQAELDSFAQGAAAQFPDTDRDWHPRIGPTTLGSTDRYKTQLLVLLGAVGFVLLIACLNVANLLLARASARTREIAIRSALGAGRGRIVRQLLTESLLLAGVGAIMGMILGWIGARALMASFPVRAPRPPMEYSGIDGSVIVFASAVTMVAGIGFGLAPAFQLSRENLNETIKRGRWGLRSALIVAETALSLILLAGAGLMVRSFARLLEVQPGFAAENVLTVQVPMPSFTNVNAPKKDVEARQTAEYHELIDRVRMLPGVTAAAISTLLPLAPMEVHTRIGFEGDPNPNQDHGAELRSVSADYFRAMGVAVLKGRPFTEADVDGAAKVGIVTDVVARRYWPNEDPIGKHVNMSGLPRGPWMEVVGVVAATRHRSMKDQPEPELYVPYEQYLGPAFGTALIVRGTTNPVALAPAIRNEIRTRYPTQPIGDVKLMTDIVSESIALPRFYTALLSVFAALALALASAGVYGVLSYSVAQRTREVGIRMALGASRSTVLKLVLGDGLLLVIAGVVIGIVGGLGLTRLIESQLYYTKPTDPATFAVAGALLIGIAMAAAYFPASRAARVNPVVALREE